MDITDGKVILTEDEKKLLQMYMDGFDFFMPDNEKLQEQFMDFLDAIMDFLGDEFYTDNVRAFNDKVHFWNGLKVFGGYERLD